MPCNNFAGVETLAVYADLLVELRGFEFRIVSRCVLIMRQDPALLPKRISPSGNLLEFLEWVAAHPRTYTETMDAWRTSCPRVPVWEDAVDGGLAERVSAGRKTLVQLTGTGRDLLSAERP